MTTRALLTQTAQVYGHSPKIRDFSGCETRRFREGNQMHVGRAVEILWGVARLCGDYGGAKLPPWAFAWGGIRVFYKYAHVPITADVPHQAKANRGRVDVMVKH